MTTALFVFGVASLAFAPGVFWLWFVARKDKFEPEPAKYVIVLFLWGMLSTVLAATASFLLIWLLVTLDITMVSGPIVIAPVVEETIKLAFLLLALKAFKGFAREVDEPMDGIVYATAVALGFASVENAGYLYGAFEAGQLAQTFINRALLSVPGHLLASSCWGYALGMALFSSRTGGWKVLTVLVGLVVAMVFHGGFNLLAISTSETTALIIGVFVVALWFVFHSNVRRALEVSPHRHGIVEKATDPTTWKDRIASVGIVGGVVLLCGLCLLPVVQFLVSPVDQEQLDREIEELLREIEELQTGVALDGGVPSDAGSNESDLVPGCEQ